MRNVPPGTRTIPGYFESAGTLIEGLWFITSLILSAAASRQLSQILMIRSISRID